MAAAVGTLFGRVGGLGRMGPLVVSIGFPVVGWRWSWHACPLALFFTAGIAPLVRVSGSTARWLVPAGALAGAALGAGARAR